MAHIRVTQAHKLPLEQAKTAAQQVADKLAEKLDMKSHWKGNVLHFTRSGVTGSLAVDAGKAVIDIKLGLMLSMLSGKIEEEARFMMKDVFAKGG
jgi:putative polyhydroxyalkanoate system protein